MKETKFQAKIAKRPNQLEKLFEITFSDKIHERRLPRSRISSARHRFSRANEHNDFMEGDDSYSTSTRVARRGGTGRLKE
jgi:hypothetical protein